MATARLVFGEGLDRETGVAAVTPSSIRNMSNVIPLRGKVQARKGMVLTAELRLPAGGTMASAVVAIFPLIAKQEALAVGWYEGSRELHLFRLPGSGGPAVTHLGLLGVVPEGASTRVHAAENFGVVLLAHDEPLVGRRLGTQAYDMFTGTLTPLMAEFDGSGSAPVRFRGVFGWGDYLAGWGFGTALEDRPELLRLSLPGEPMNWDPNHYFVAGSRGEPITGVGEAGTYLIVFKASRHFRVVGESPLNFGILPLHALIGCPHHSLILSLEDGCYFWSNEGPRMVAQGDEGDLAEPLDLEGEQPLFLPPVSPLSEGHAVYRPGVRLVEWVFGSRSYVLSLAGGQRRWTYHERAVLTMSSSLLYTGGATLIGDVGDPGGSGPPTSYSSITSLQASATTVRVNMTNTGVDGNETGEVWLKPGDGDWFMAREFSPAPGTQQVLVEELVPTTFYLLAVRHRRAGNYTAGYTDPNPASWPSGSQGSFETTLVAPVLNSATWARISGGTERVRLVITPADLSISHQVLKDNVVVATLAPGVTSTDVTAITGETYNSWTARAVAGSYASAPSNAIYIWNGPTVGPLNLRYFNFWEAQNPCSGGANVHNVYWEEGTPGARTEIWVAGAPVQMNEPGVVESWVCAQPNNPDIQGRHAVTTFGAVDYTPLVPSTEI
jgi:hypothetical protein